jgi:hypothetical protein
VNLAIKVMIVIGAPLKMGIIHFERVQNRAVIWELGVQIMRRMRHRGITPSQQNIAPK